MMKRNTLLFYSLIGLVVLFMSVMVYLFTENRQEFKQYAQRATEQALVQHQENEWLRGRMSALESHLDSLSTLYRTDSTAWHHERDTLQSLLTIQQRATQKFENAYESSKKALEKQRLPRIYDLAPILNNKPDSTDHSQPEGQ